MYALMNQISRYLVLLVAIEHVWIMIVEIFMWKSTIAKDLFEFDAEEAELTAPLAKVLGLYNGFLGVGLMWAFMATGIESYNLRIFLFSCVLAAGLMSSAIFNRKFFVIQAVPAGLALLLMTLNY